jgi:hypothetical protein
MVDLNAFHFFSQPAMNHSFRNRNTTDGTAFLLRGSFDETQNPNCKRLKSLGIDSASLLAWRAGTSDRVVVPAGQAGNRFLGHSKNLQIRTQFIFYGLGCKKIRAPASSLHGRRQEKL